MSESKQQQILANKDRKKVFNKKRFVKFIVVLILIVGLAIGAFWYFDFYIKDQETLKQEQALIKAQEEKAAKSETVYNEALGKSNSGDYASGQSLLDDEIKDANNSSDQAWIYIQKSSIALNADQYDDAYGFAARSEELNPSVSSARLMAVAAEKKGDNEDAISKYRLTLSRIIGSSELNELDRKEIRGYIQQLGGSI